MAPTKKRTRAAASDASDDDDAFSVASGSAPASDAGSSDDEIDISSALTGRKKRKLGPLAPSHFANDADEDGDDGIEELIRESIAKRNTKEGTGVVKSAKGGKNKLAKGEIGGGSFQSMGLYPWLLRILTLQGFRTPTPIQRISIPILLQSPPRDLVGMARTGSGKSLAFLIPLIQRLGGRHASTFGARALIMLPTRELALQVMKVGKELARGWREGEGGHAGDREGEDAEGGKRSQGLRWGLIVGGESLDEQFEMISSNPDVIIATPGRLLHLAVEMNLDLKSVQYVVFDEADRLFEMGFETALTEIVHRLPAGRQTALFSATLPKSLVEFARAGLENPKLVRLDADSKISADLRMAFFSVKQDEKDAALLSLLRDVIGVPQGSLDKHQDEGEEDEEGGKRKKGKRRADAHREHAAAPHQTLVFAATKHHVEYLTTLLTAAGLAVAHIYGALDQAARGQQMARFRAGAASVLVVTDVAARGIDIPVLAHVVNYDFPQGARVFVHRVGRTARAGRQGWAWSFVTAPELPHLLDLQLFLGRPLLAKLPPARARDEAAYAQHLVLGPFARAQLDEETEYVKVLDAAAPSLPALRAVMRKGQAMYERSRGKASQASYRRAKDMSREPARWGLAGAASGGLIHPALLLKGARAAELAANEEIDAQRADLLAAVTAFRPAETVLEIGAKARLQNADLMRARRGALVKARERAAAAPVPIVDADSDDSGEEEGVEEDEGEGAEVEMADEAEITAAFDTGDKAHKYRDAEFYMGYEKAGAAADRGYSLRDGASFVEQAAHATFDLAGDEGIAAQRRAAPAWDKKKKKFVAGGGAGADNVKLVRTESGVKLPASYRTGRFDDWKKARRVALPRVGEAEGEAARRFAGGGPRYRHTGATPGKPLDKLATDYERKSRQQQGRARDAAAAPGATNDYGGWEKGARPDRRAKPGQGKGGKPGLARHGGKPAGRVKSELKSADQIRRERNTAEKKRQKNARAPKKGGGGKGKRR